MSWPRKEAPCFGLFLNTSIVQIERFAVIHLDAFIYHPQYANIPNKASVVNLDFAHKMLQAFNFKHEATSPQTV